MFDADLHRAWSVAHRAGRHAENLRMVDASLQARPDDPHLHLLRATSLLGLERDADSLAAAHRAVECGKDDAAALTRAGSMCFHAGDLATARKCVDRAKRVKTRNFIFRKELKELGRNLRRREKGLEQERRLSRAFDGVPSDRRVARELARRLVRTGRTYAAYHVVARALLYHPDDGSLRRLEKKLSKTVPDDERTAAMEWAASGEPRTTAWRESAGGNRRSGDENSHRERRRGMM